MNNVQGTSVLADELTRKFPLILDLQTFADDGDDNDDNKSDKDDDGDNDENKDGDGGKTFTQAELDAKIADRLARQSKKYADYDELKTKLTTFEQAEEERKKAALSVEERLQAEKDDAIKKAEEAETSAQGKVDAANQRLIKAEFRAKARELGVRTDALDDAYKLADISGVSVDDEGNAIGVEDVVKALITNKPYIVEPTKKEPRKIGGGNGGGDEKPEKTKEQLLAAAAEKAQKSGRIEDRMAYAALKDELNK